MELGGGAIGGRSRHEVAAIRRDRSELVEPGAGVADPGAPCSAFARTSVLPSCPWQPVSAAADAAGFPFGHGAQEEDGDDGPAAGGAGAAEQGAEAGDRAAVAG